MSEKEQWEDDLFDRKHYADFLTQTLLNSGQPTFVLNIDSSWGSGKSFFLQHWYERKLGQVLFRAFIVL